MRTKYVCATCNNYSDFDVIHLRSLVGRGIASYVIFGRETGDNGTRHLQIYVEFPKRLRFNQLREVLPGYHIESRRGTPKEASDYCEKDQDFEIFGEISVGGPGFRSDLAQLHESLQSGKRLRDIADDHFGCFVKYQRGISAYRLVKATSRNWLCSVVIYWGRTGAGKTRAVIDNSADIDDIYIHPGGPWFDGYDGQDIVLFDDFSGSEFKISYLLKLLDRYPMRVPVKGGFVQWTPREIYITSNKDPLLWYSGALNEHQNALIRRVTNCVEFQ